MNWHSLSIDDREKLLRESRRIMDKHPDRVPIIVRTRNCKIILDKNKFLVPDDLTISQFIYVLRKRIRLDDSQCIFLLCENLTITGSALVKDIYKERMDTSTEMLFIDVALENTFG